MVDTERTPRAAERAAWHQAFSGILRVEDRFYILATSSLADDRPRVMKQGDTFALFDHYGDIKPVGLEEEGVYHEGTRFLSSMVLRFGSERPMFLSSTVRHDGALLTVDLTNPDVTEEGRLTVPRGTLHIQRSKLLWQGVCYERLVLRNYGRAAMRAELAFHFAADFADIFEVRGLRRPRRGRFLDPRVGVGEVVLGYEGLDGVERHSSLRFDPAPAALDDGQAGYDLTLLPGERRELFVTLSCGVARARPQPLRWEHAAAVVKDSVGAHIARGVRISTSNEQLEQWLKRSRADLAMMTTETPEGLYPYAGIPWFSTPFGRDGIITARECLWIDPELARGVLRFLAANQATEHDPDRDAEPGKILHELRRGEMAALREIPFGRYYGSVDSTPLFVMLAGAFYRRTGDLEEVERLWPHVEAALQWIETSGDLDGDGFVEYQRRSRNGLANQGWKDSLRLGLPRRRRPGRRLDRAVRGAGLRLRGPARRRRPRRGARFPRSRDRPRASGRAPATSLRGGLLVRRSRHLRPRARRRQAALSRARLEPGALSLHRQRVDGAREPAGGDAARRRLVLGLGGSHAGRRRSALQPDVVPRRLDLAARQRADRCTVSPAMD